MQSTVAIRQRMERTMAAMDQGKVAADGKNVIIHTMSAEELAEGLAIYYDYGASPYGLVIIAATDKGICYMGFIKDVPRLAEDETKPVRDAVKDNTQVGASKSVDKGTERVGPGTAVEGGGTEELKRRFPGAVLVHSAHVHHRMALSAFEQGGAAKGEIVVKLHLKATAFQLKVWKKLLEIPAGGLVSYSWIAGNASNARATGRAVGDNPIGYLIPCHRVVRADGSFDRYYWGEELKAEMIAREGMVTGDGMIAGGGMAEGQG